MHTLFEKKTKNQKKPNTPLFDLFSESKVKTEFV